MSEAPLFHRTRAHVLVCTGPSCGRAGARRLFEGVWHAMEKRRLAYYAGGEVRLTAAGCLGACSHGPNAVAYYGGDDGAIAQAWYHGLDEGRLLRIVNALDRGDGAPDEGRYDR